MWKEERREATAVKVYDALIALLCSVTLTVGLTVSGMIHPKFVRGFFSTYDNFALGATFGGGLISFSAIYYLLVPLLRRPLVCSVTGTNRGFPEKAVQKIDQPLVLGSALFGIGWAFGGFCPGPAFIAAVGATHTPNAIWFTFAMLSGMFAASLKTAPTIKQIVRLVVCFVLIGLFGLWRPSIDTTRVHLTFVSLLYGFFGSTPGSPALLQSLFGGFLIGGSIGAMFLLSGLSLGISGVVSRIFAGPLHLDWYRMTFFVGMLFTGKFMSLIYPEMFYSNEIQDGGIPWGVIVGGFLVGFGTFLSNGCTSGHGILGCSRLAPRSFVATGTFMVAHFTTAQIINAL
eukprot:TRINITY_DN5182_c0_g1_i1.p1 TRINITY_DN5182_c0_g1~~TRINITY_DN5182_c0_g1_i1.p1  ORF type:complete len:344 (-),score=108.38 TRINITY_DN5182_c0_g1_i1:43-1074(-)